MRRVMTYKVYIIDEVHMLTTGAFNARSNPGRANVAQVSPFILATTENRHKTPATIIRGPNASTSAALVRLT